MVLPPVCTQGDTTSLEWMVSPQKHQSVLAWNPAAVPRQYAKVWNPKPSVKDQTAFLTNQRHLGRSASCEQTSDSCKRPNLLSAASLAALKSTHALLNLHS